MVRKTRTERRREEVREEILEATVEVLVEQGVRGLTLAGVARRLGLTKPALYYYFDSKEALMLEVVLRWTSAEAAVVAAAVEPTETGADAVEALIRAVATYHTSKSRLRASYLAPQVGASGINGFTEAQLERIRPYNDRLYGGVAERIRRDQSRGLVSAAVEPRRTAFLAHVSTIGLLTVEGLVEMSDDPLVHSHDVLVDDLVGSFRRSLRI